MSEFYISEEDRAAALRAQKTIDTAVAEANLRDEPADLSALSMDDWAVHDRLWHAMKDELVAHRAEGEGVSAYDVSRALRAALLLRVVKGDDHA